MANDNKQIKAAPAPKTETAAKDKSASGESSSKTESAGGASKTESGAKSDAAPANYSRGEGQKPVSDAYRENWNLIFANKNSRRKKR
jgi:hypothetical protein